MRFNKTETKKFKIRFSIFILMLLIVLVSLEFVIYTNNDGPAGWTYVYNDEIDVLVMGASHVYCSIDVPYINDNLNKNTVALAQGCMNAEMAYFSLVEVLKYQHPDIIILEAYSVITDVLYDTEGTDLDALIRGNLNGMKPSFNKYHAAVSMLGTNSYTVFEVLRKDNSFKLWEFIKNPYKTKQEDVSINPNRGYQPMAVEQRFSDKTYEKRLDPDIDYDFKLPKENIKYFKKIIKLCEDYDVHLEVIKVPVLRTSEYISGCIAIQEFLDENNYDITLVNLMEEKYNISLEKKDYFDGDHLNITGAAKIADWFVDYLEDYYNNLKNE